MRKDSEGIGRDSQVLWTIQPRAKPSVSMSLETSIVWGHPSEGCISKGIWTEISFFVRRAGQWLRNRDKPPRSSGAVLALQPRLRPRKTLTCSEGGGQVTWLCWSGLSCLVLILFLPTAKGKVPLSARKQLSAVLFQLRPGNRVLN